MFLWVFTVFVLLALFFFATTKSSLNLYLATKFGTKQEVHFEGKIVWIVGASSGIGEFLARHIASFRDVHLILTARRVHELGRVRNDLINSLGMSPDSVKIIPMDVTEFDKTEEVVKRANTIFGRTVDIVVLNSGRSQRSAFGDVSVEVDLDCFKLNALGPTEIARKQLTHFLEVKKGQFVVVSSMCGVIPAPLSPSYTAAKHALMGYFRLLAVEYADRNVDVSIVCPALTFAPNNVLNAFTGNTGEKHGQVLMEKTSSHMSPECCADLICSAASNRLAESWISQTPPVLLVAYVVLANPDIFLASDVVFRFRVVRLLGFDRLQRIRTGGAPKCASKLAAVSSSSPILSTVIPKRSLLGELSSMNSLRFETIGAKKVAVFDEKFENDDEVAKRIALYKGSKTADDAFAVCNLATVVERFVEWRRRLPRVEPFYAVKCNDDLTLMTVLASLGTGFDCASKAEIDVVLNNKLSSPDRIVYANPCKTRSFVKHAEARGISMMTFDNEEELLKVSATHANPQMILRIAVSDQTAQCPLNVKFGSEPVEDAPRLLMKAKNVGIKVIGISFHVGSGCNDPSAFREAVCHAKRLFDIGQSLGHPMDLVDIGGGYPGSDGGSITFAKIADVVGGALDEFFPESLGMRIIAEPGRYFASAPFSLITNVISTARVPASRITNNAADEAEEGYMYYMNDGVYGSFNCIFYDHVHPTGAPLFEAFNEEDNKLFPTTIWGPTCDGLDQVEVSTKMRRLSVGDWLLYRNMGAYTMAAASTFNGFEKPQVYYFMDHATWQHLSFRLTH
ncbi:hypothetical protein QR680_005133 [Steinernema hermaphroditum]|uniref:ornithine decarboxylase n=1 Tax=Steinernema hermaphroditum TaxID=289476 RepID=A0AA39HT48_9BILA|nr:hypothetical protein QR680_005133 [Steinernema hermaphroditum]